MLFFPKQFNWKLRQLYPNDFPAQFKTLQYCKPFMSCVKTGYGWKEQISVKLLLLPSSAGI